MVELVILYAHFRADDLTRFHYEVLRQANPNVPIIPVRFEENAGLDPSFTCPCPEADQWRGTDRLYHPVRTITAGATWRPNGT
jgi:hypothetical protein